jgi:hypothetical protein
LVRKERDKTAFTGKYPISRQILLRVLRVQVYNTPLTRHVPKPCPCTAQPHLLRSVRPVRTPLPLSLFIPTPPPARERNPTLGFHAPPPLPPSTPLRRRPTSPWTRAARGPCRRAPTVAPPPPSARKVSILVASPDLRFGSPRSFSLWWGSLGFSWMFLGRIWDALGPSVAGESWVL